MHHLNSLFTRIAGGDEKAFNKIYYHYHPVLFSRIRRFIRDEIAAQDLTQTVFINLWLHGEPLKEVQNPAAWLNRSAANCSLNYLRQQYIRRNRETAVGYAATTYTSHDQDLGYRKLQRWVLEALEQLPSPDRTILQLHLDSGYGPRLIARELELPEGRVKKILEHTRNDLRLYIRERLGIWLPWILLVAAILSAG